MGNRASAYGRTSHGPAFRTALCVCCALIALLLIAAAAMGEDTLTWEQRMEQARKKYNKKTVNVYVRGQGRYRKGRINVCFYRAEKGYISINIRESVEITDEAEIEAVLELVTKNKYYSAEQYGTISFMKAQWITHNIAYGMATGSAPQQSWAGLIAGMDPTELATHVKELDLTPVGFIPDDQKMIYNLVELMYCHRETEAKDP